jgi:hypothetical protein
MFRAIAGPKNPKNNLLRKSQVTKKDFFNLTFIQKKKNPAG